MTLQHKYDKLSKWLHVLSRQHLSLNRPKNPMKDMSENISITYVSIGYPYDTLMSGLVCICLHTSNVM